MQGLLRPGSGADPPMPSGWPDVPQAALRVYLGRSAGYTLGDDVTVLKIRNTPILRLRRTVNGMAITANIFGEDGKTIAQIIDNRFYVNPANFFRIERPDEHSLRVYDINRVKVLDIEFINPHSVRVLGVFNYPKLRPVIITEDEVRIGGNRFLGTCFSSLKVLIQVE